MVELTYFQLSAFLIIFLIIGGLFTWRFERSRYEHIIDIFRTENEKLKEAFYKEVQINETLKENFKAENEKLENALNEKTMKIDRLKKRLNSLYGEK